MKHENFKAGPPGGEGIKPKTTTKEKVRSMIERVNSVIWIGIDGYFLYAFCYIVVWQHIRFENKSAAIIILVIFCSLNLYAIIAWVAMQAWGPGKINKKYTERTNKDPDDAFICDEQGYSLYCSYCKQIKPNRTHHASYTDTCVPVMDHYCPWVGNVIGQGNLKFFLQFSWSMLTAVILVIVTLLIYQHDHIPHINGNSIALYILASIVLLFLLALVTQHAFYILWAHTTLEHMGYRRGNIPYINIIWRDGIRRVVQPTKRDIMMPRASPFDQGTWQNIRNVMGPFYSWSLPIRGTLYEPEFNPKFIEMMRNRIKE